MYTWQVRYGIDIGLLNVSIAPLGPKARAFVFAAGSLTVAYSADAVAVGAWLQSSTRTHQWGGLARV